VELAIDTVGMHSSVAVSDEGRTVVEISWRTGRRHTPTLVPTIDEAMRRAGIERGELTAVFVDAGPGAYGGIRAGMAAATGIAVALDLPAVAVGRLEIEAYAHAAAVSSGRRVVAIHMAGRAQWAMARYAGAGDGAVGEGWTELDAPCLVSLEELEAILAPSSEGGSIVGGGAAMGESGVCCGEVDALPAASREALQRAGWTLATGAASMRRAGLLAELGWRRLEAARGRGEDLQAGRLQPIYLREPAIGPQPPLAAKAIEEAPEESTR